MEATESCYNLDMNSIFGRVGKVQRNIHVHVHATCCIVDIKPSTDKDQKYKPVELGDQLLVGTGTVGKELPKEFIK